MLGEPASRRAEFLHGARDTIPMIVGAIPFGILFGALAVGAGLSVAGAMGMSLFVFAGSSQFVAATMLAQGAGIVVIVVTTFIVNVRHALYAASLGPHVRHLPHRWLMPLGFFLTDETYAVVIKRYGTADTRENNHWYYLGSAVAMYINWQLCTFIGIYAGSSLKGLADWGLEFAMVVTFIGIVVPLVTDRPMLLTAIVAVTAGLLLRDLPHNLGLIIASVLAIAVGYFTETLTGAENQ